MGAQPSITHCQTTVQLHFLTYNHIKATALSRVCTIQSSHCEHLIDYSMKTSD